MSERGNTSDDPAASPSDDSAELELRDREIALKEAEQRTREEALNLSRDEFLLKKQQAMSSKWASPLVVAVLAASIAGIGNAGIAVINGRLQRELEYNKAESDLVLEVVKTGDPEKAAANLRFLLDTKLIIEPSRVTGIRNYLQTRTPGTGISLPAADRNFSFEKTTGATPEAIRSVSSGLSPYIKHLVDIGFPSSIPQASIRIDPNETNPSYYLPDKGVIVLSPQGAKDELFPLAEYSIHVLEFIRPSREHFNVRREWLEYGIRDYLVASYLNDPQLGSRYTRIFGVEAPSLQLLTPRTYGKVTDATESHEAGAIWANAFWQMRTTVGAAKVDRLVASAWLKIPPSMDDSSTPTAFTRNILSLAASLDEGDRRAVEQILRNHQLPGS